jgi:hypothetical protein
VFLKNYSVFISVAAFHHKLQAFYWFHVAILHCLWLTTGK